MERVRQPSSQAMSLVLALDMQPAIWRYGYELGAEVGLKSGSLYPILMRLAERGLLEARWEDEPPPGRPARHLYRLTAEGLSVAANARTGPARRRPRFLLGEAT
jgi:PadR family transcriptional regulator, regulatory protein PadR